MTPFLNNVPRFFTNSRPFWQVVKRQYAVILGIETSCDDTGCGIVDTQGNILGESLHSQHLVHLK